MTANPAGDFREAIQAAGLTPPEVVEADGKFHRFASNGKRGDDAGWYIFYDDGIPAGAFGCWRTGFAQEWRYANGRTFSHEEEAAHRAKVEAMRHSREAEEARRREEAQARAAAIWEGAHPASADHPYLRCKGVGAHGLRDYEGRLVVPMRDGAQLHSLQFIGADGDKRFLTGGRVRGCYYAIGKPKAVLCVAEGYATAASIHEATGYAVAVAFNAGNLEPVAQTLRKKYPDVAITLCADDDRRTAGNPGLTKARAAALAVGARVAVPDFGPDRPDGATDFNDLAQHLGTDAVARAVAGATTPASGESRPDRENWPSGEPTPSRNDVAAIARLAALSPLDYDRARTDEAKTLGVRPGTLDKMVAMARKHDASDGMDFLDVEPWPDPIDPASLLTEISATVRRFIVCQPETADAVALWVAMTWFMDEVQVAPLAVITAPEKRCGKSQLLVLLGRLTHRPLMASNISPAALFRSVDAWRPTLLVDEADSFMRENEELRGIINAGHTRDSAYVVRVVGEDLTPKRFNVWGAKALAGIGHLADTLMDRAVVLELRRKLPHETAERLRHAEPDLFQILAEKLARFAEDYGEAVRRARPALPAVLNDRAQDNWEPLLAVAVVAGGAWPELGRNAALRLSVMDSPAMSAGTELLADIRDVFEERRADRISTADLIAALCNDGERPWATYNRGKPISPRQVAKRLSEYGISSHTVRIGYETPKGFLLKQFEDAFSRYLATPSPASATAPHASIGAALVVAQHPTRSGNKILSETPNPAPDKACGGVADSGPSTDENVEVL